MNALAVAVVILWSAGAASAAAPTSTVVSESTAARAARRAYDGAPPTIPHEPMDGACNSCHGEEAMEAGDAVAPAFPHSKTAGLNAESRCVQCHVYRKAVATFRGSTFTGFLQDVTRHGARKARKAAPDRPHRGFMREDCRVCHLGAGARPELVPRHGPRKQCAGCHPTRDRD